MYSLSYAVYAKIFPDLHPQDSSVLENFRNILNDKGKEAKTNPNYSDAMLYEEYCMKTLKPNISASALVQNTTSRWSHGFGSSVDINSDGSIIVIGAPKTHNEMSSSVYVFVNRAKFCGFDSNSVNWDKYSRYIQVQHIVGPKVKTKLDEEKDTNFGGAISLTHTGVGLAVGAYLNAGDDLIDLSEIFINGSETLKDVGETYIYQQYIQTYPLLSLGITFEIPFFESISPDSFVGKGYAENSRGVFQGYSLSFSGDGTYLAVGGPGDDSHLGQKVINKFDKKNWYSLNELGAVWIFKCNFSHNASHYDDPTAHNASCYQFGSKLVPSPDTYQRVFTINNDGGVSQFYQDAYYLIGGVGFGWSVALSGDGTVLAVGGPFNQNYTGAGWVFILNTSYANDFDSFDRQKYMNESSYIQQAVISSTEYFQYQEEPNYSLIFQGYSLALSYDGTLLAIGTPLADKNTGSIILYGANNKSALSSSSQTSLDYLPLTDVNTTLTTIKTEFYPFATLGVTVAIAEVPSEEFDAIAVIAAGAPNLGYEVCIPGFDLECYTERYGGVVIFEAVCNYGQALKSNWQQEINYDSSYNAVCALCSEGQYYVQESMNPFQSTCRSCPTLQYSTCYNNLYEFNDVDEQCPYISFKSQTNSWHFDMKVYLIVIPVFAILLSCVMMNWKTFQAAQCINLILLAVANCCNSLNFWFVFNAGYFQSWTLLRAFTFGLFFQIFSFPYWLYWIRYNPPRMVFPIHPTVVRILNNLQESKTVLNIVATFKPNKEILLLLLGNEYSVIRRILLSVYDLLKFISYFIIAIFVTVFTLKPIPYMIIWSIVHLPFYVFCLVLGCLGSFTKLMAFPILQFGWFYLWSGNADNIETNVRYAVEKLKREEKRSRLKADRIEARMGPNEEEAIYNATYYGIFEKNRNQDTRNSNVIKDNISTDTESNLNYQRKDPLRRERYSGFTNGAGVMEETLLDDEISSSNKSVTTSSLWSSLFFWKPQNEKSTSKSSQLVLNDTNIKSVEATRNEYRQSGSSFKSVSEEDRQSVVNHLLECDQERRLYQQVYYSFDQVDFSFFMFFQIITGSVVFIIGQSINISYLTDEGNNAGSLWKDCRVLESISLSLNVASLMYILKVIKIQSRDLNKDGTRGEEGVNDEDIIAAAGLLNMDTGVVQSLKSAMVLSAPDLILDPRELKLERIISRGTFGVVYEGKLNNSVPVAAKSMFVRKLGDDDVAKEVQQEMKILSRLRHPGIVAFLGVCFKGEENQESRIYLVQELCVETIEAWILREVKRFKKENEKKKQNNVDTEKSLESESDGTHTGKETFLELLDIRRSDVSNIIEKDPENGYLKEIPQEISSSIYYPLRHRRRLLDICKTVSTTMIYIHRRGIAHRDIKPANLLLDAAGNVKICDLGLSTYNPYFRNDEIVEGRGKSGTGKEKNSFNERAQSNNTSPKNSSGISYRNQMQMSQAGLDGGTCGYKPPETARIPGFDPSNPNASEEQIYDPEKWDIFSLGGVFHFLFSGEHPFETQYSNDWNFYAKVMESFRRNVHPMLHISMPQRLQKLTHEMWSNNPLLRPSLDKIIEELESINIMEVDQIGVVHDSRKNHWRDDED